MNQYKQKELYKHACETFFTSDSVDAFKKSIFSSINCETPNIQTIEDAPNTAAAA